MLAVKKLIYFFSGLLVFLFILPLTSQAAQSEWLIESKADYLYEKVEVNDPDFTQNLDISGWELTHSGEKTILERKSRDWKSYKLNQDQFPLLIQSKNYFVYQKIDIEFAPIVTAHPLLEKILEQGELDLKFNIYSIKNQLSESPQETKSLVFASIDEINQMSGTKILEYTKVDGFATGVSIFLIGFATILIVYIRRIRKVYALISEEYALIDPEEKLAQEEVQTDELDKEKD